MENAKIEKRKTSSPEKINYAGEDVFQNAKMFKIFPY